MDGITGIINQEFIDQQVAATAQEGQGNGFDSDQFLQILMVQLQNQDPYNTMDSSEIMQFQATLTEVEQSLKQTQAVESLNESMALNVGALNEMVADIAVTVMDLKEGLVGGEGSEGGGS